MTPLIDAQDSLLVEIARCPVMEACLSSGATSHCEDVILYQWDSIPAEERRERWRLGHHVPEPWVGHLERAPLLFLSSNPSLSSKRPRHAPTEPAPAFPNAEALVAKHPAVARGLQNPRAAWTDPELIDRFSAAFDIWMPDGVRQIADSEGSLGKPQPFWNKIKRIAISLHDREIVPGVDYALTEVVHCKSRDEAGVTSAIKECVPRYLRRMLALSPAAVIVVLGTPARNAFRTEFSYPDAGTVSAPMEIAGRLRRVVFLAGPAARGKTKYPKRPPDASLPDLRHWLRENAPPKVAPHARQGDIEVARLPSDMQDDGCVRALRVG